MDSWGAFEAEEADNIVQLAVDLAADGPATTTHHAVTAAALTALARRLRSWDTLKLAMLALDLAEAGRK